VFGVICGWVFLAVGQTALNGAQAIGKALAAIKKGNGTAKHAKDANR
jgi:hypothetical protein